MTNNYMIEIEFVGPRTKLGRLDAKFHKFI